jgi:hypothetical protein
MTSAEKNYPIEEQMLPVPCAALLAAFHTSGLVRAREVTDFSVFGQNENGNRSYWQSSPSFS